MIFSGVPRNPRASPSGLTQEPLKPLNAPDEWVPRTTETRSKGSALTLSKNPLHCTGGFFPALSITTWPLQLGRRNLAAATSPLPGTFTPIGRPHSPLSHRSPTQTTHTPKP